MSCLRGIIRGSDNHICTYMPPEGLATQICHFYFLSLSANLFAYFFLRLSFSLFLPFWTFLFSYFLPHPPSISTPFSYLLPSLENGVTSNIDILLAPLSYRPQISICHPFPPFMFIPIPIFLSFLLVRKFSYCFLFPLFLTYFFLFYLILSPAYFFVSFFSFSLLSSKIGSKDFLILG